VNQNEIFQQEVKANIESLGKDKDLQALSRIWVREISRYKWAYNFSWMGRPAIQFPNDTWAIQELVWLIKPDLIIETGIAHGGSLVFNASMLALLDMAEAIESGTSFNPKTSKRKVLGIDIDIRSHNRTAIEEHPMASRIKMIQGSSIDQQVIEEVSCIAKDYQNILICLDSNHTHDHVLAELEAYAPFTSIGSYCLVFDTLIDDMPDDLLFNRPWGSGNNPKTAVREYLRLLKGEGRQAADGEAINFEIDRSIESKLLITVAPDGYLKRIS